jgi:arabinose-5-phosphate isomerase
MRFGILTQERYSSKATGNMQHKKKQHEIIGLGKQLLAHAINELQAIELSIDDGFLKFITALQNREGKVIVTGVGKSGHIAGKFASTLSSTGAAAVFLHPAEAAHGDLGMIDKNDVVIALSNSGETSELIPILDYCREYGVKVLSITANKDSRLASASEASLLLPKLEELSELGAPTTSCLATLLLCDVIAVVLHKYRGFRKDDYKRLHPAGAIGKQLMQAKDIMHTNEEMPLVLEGESLSNTVFEMTNKRLGCTGVINSEKKLVGIITDGDLRRHIGDLGKEGVTAAGIMTKRPVTTTQHRFVSEILEQMEEKGILNIFVVNDHAQPIGILHMHDILKQCIL